MPLIIKYYFLLFNKTRKGDWINHTTIDYWNFSGKSHKFDYEIRMAQEREIINAFRSNKDNLGGLMTS
jgi:hypothetical protein